MPGLHLFDSVLQPGVGFQRERLLPRRQGILGPLLAVVDVAEQGEHGRLVGVVEQRLLERRSGINILALAEIGGCDPQQPLRVMGVVFEHLAEARQRGIVVASLVGGGAEAAEQRRELPDVLRPPHRIVPYPPPDEIELLVELLVRDRSIARDTEREVYRGGPVLGSWVPESGRRRRGGPQ